MTHPDITTFVEPLFAFGVKRVREKQKPSLPLAEERVVDPDGYREKTG